MSENKVYLINQGRLTIIEAEIDELCREVRDKGMLEATMDYHYAVHNAEISFIVVGTPSSKKGNLKLKYIYDVTRQVGEAMRDKTVFILWQFAAWFFREQILRLEKLLLRLLARRGEGDSQLCLISSSCVKEQLFMTI